MGDAKMRMDDTLPMTAKESTEVLGMKGVLEEASRIPLKNVKHIVVYVFLLLPLAFLCIFLHLAIPPLRKEVRSDGDDPSMITKSIVCIFSFGICFYLIFHTTFLFGTILTVHHTSDLYKRKSSAFMELLSRTATTWKKIAGSRLLSFLVAYSYMFLVVYLTMAFGFISASHMVTNIGGLVELAVALYHVYCMVNTTLAYVSHILEDGDELKALEEAGNLIGRGKTRAYLMLFLLQFGAPISLLLVIRIGNPFRAGILLRYVVECGLVVLMSISQLCIFMFFTVLYYEIDKSKGERSVDGTNSMV